MSPKEPGDYDIGYGKPPAHTRFRKGQSGNPKGRPKGAASVATLLDRALDERVAVKDGNKRRKITKREAIITQLVNKSAGADFRAMRILLDLLREYDRQQHGSEGSLSAPTDNAEADREIVQELIARLRKATEPGNEG